MDLSPYVNVVDVYEAASDIGRDLEQLAEKYGAEAIEKLVPKICIVLEQLEQSVVRYEKETVCRMELQTMTEQMEQSRVERKQSRLRHDTELSQMEMEWHQEVAEMTAAMDVLITENTKLQLRLASSKSNRSDAAPSQGGQTQDDYEGHLALTSSMSSASVSSLKEAVTKCKEEVRAKTHELEESQALLSNTQLEAEKLTTSVQVQKKRNRNLQNQARKLMEEKNQLAIQLRECMLQMITLEHDMRTLQQTGSGAASSPYLPVNVSEKSSASGSDYQEDASSPDSARFTVNELRSLINERNQLKIKVMELQDELSALRAASSASSNMEMEKAADSMEEIELDAPVQGPINREPWDKLESPSRRPRPKESTIRSLFRGLFGDNSVLSQGIFYNVKESTAHLAD